MNLLLQRGVTKHKRFQHTIHISESDIDELKHVNNIVYLKWVQEVASKHWELLSNKDEQNAYKWVASRHEIDYLKPSFLGDELEVETWVEEMQGVKSIRRVDFKKEGIIVVQAKTTWVMIDGESGRPKRISDDLSSRFI